ncbi:Crp/Fnr family transcriptional regulator [Thalassomonas actiniarum]|uniref:Crp/Fnr family transcriptional regulator n=1 Tax=Thalassomonas actiniarum TaxID=485447 RepID=A0AAE9YMW5_9GAMM|nr:Crp/Fnr family transcriptional regulator [Thalassomonas actiniarum]WDD97094.1 Crp/Fnr family transcriptional regulator [Thalassomonas actiniarum]
MTLTQKDFVLSCLSAYGNQAFAVDESLSVYFRHKRLAKGVTYLESGQRWQSFTVIREGSFRLYYLDSRGREHSKGFFGAEQIMAPCAPAAIKQPANFFIEALTAVSCYQADYAKVRRLLESSQWGLSVLMSLLERVLDEKVQREYAWLNLDAEARYVRFLKDHPVLSSQLPLYLIANYLGMTDVTLSRIRKKLALTSA